MKFKALLLVCITALGGTVLAGELEDILDKHYKALGGLEALGKITSMKAVGKLVIISPGGDMEMPIDMQVKGMTKVRMDTSFQGQAITQAYDGETGWQIMPMMGITEPQDMNEDDVKNLKENAQFLGLLYNWEEKGHKLELLGKEEVEGTDAYKIQVTTKSGDVKTIYLDAEYFLEIKNVSIMKQQGMEMEAHAYSSDYKPLNGVMFAYAVQIKTPDGTDMMAIQIESIEVNPTIDDQIFVKPEPVEAEGDQ